MSVLQLIIKVEYLSIKIVFFFTRYSQIRDFPSQIVLFEETANYRLETRQLLKKNVMLNPKSDVIRSF